jgi:NAD(P)-dependent dehydrogenase (short-subunit alcohol dehydrogenase family)
MLNIDEIIGLKGKNVVITGAASGMAKAATELLIELGAKVYAIDLNEVDLPVEKVLRGDLSKPEVIDEIVEQLPDEIDAAYICHGIALIPGNPKKVMDINFFSNRYLAEKVLPKVVDEGSITFISSTGGYEWNKNMKNVSAILETKGFADGNAWIDENKSLFETEGFPDSYCFSKQCLSAYVKASARSGEYIKRHVRVNAIGPSYTSTGLIKDFNLAVSQDGSEESGAQVMYDVFLKSWNGRPGKSEEMGYPLVIIGSHVCSYLHGQVIYIDFGMTGEMDFNSAM